MLPLLCNRRRLATAGVAIVACIGVVAPPRAGASVDPDRPAASESAPRWSLVRQADGHLAVVRGDAVAGSELSDPDVLSVETDVAEHTLAGIGENDPMRAQQWALDRAPFEAAWATTRGAGVIVAVVDTGVDAAHEDLGSVVLPGIDYIDPSRDGRFDPAGHGTHVAGIIAARINNARGIVGAAPAVRILPVRVLDADGSGVSSNVAAGIIWAADHGARVINVSLGGGPSSGVQMAIQYARKKQVVVVAAAGNNGASGNTPVYPAAYPEAVAVGAYDQNMTKPAFSNSAAYVDLSAPGNEILSTWSTSSSSYAVASGTSMATPYAAAEAALVVAANPKLSAGSVISIMEATAHDAGAPGFDPNFGHGQINPLGAVRAATPKIAGYGTQGHGYWVVGKKGSVRAYGDAGLYGDAHSLSGVAAGGSAAIVASARTASGRGYWLAAANGAVYGFGDAHFYGGMNGAPLNSPIVGMSGTPSGQGYILLGADGGIFTFGDAKFRGSTGGMRLNARVLDLAMTRSGNGYWFVATDGGVFSFGDARFHGSTGSMRLSAPVMSMASAADGRGYWLVASDGGIFAFDVPFQGSMPSVRGAGFFPATLRMRAVPSGNGYLLLGANGSVNAFGTARYFGSATDGAIDLMLAR